MEMTNDNEKSPKSINQNVLNEDVSDVENRIEDYDPGDEDPDEDHDDDDYDDDDDDDYDPNDDETDYPDEDSVEDYQDFLYSLFPSKYLKNKIKDKNRNKTESIESSKSS